MRHHLILSLWLGMSTFLFLQVQGQDQKKISGTFDNYSFSRLADTLEAATGYHFYFDPVDLDSLSIDISLNKATLTQVLDRLFENTRFHYAIDTARRVFITSQVTIVTTLPAWLGGPAGNRPPVNIPFPDEQDQPERTKLRKTLIENQLIEIGNKLVKAGQPKATIAGYVKDDKTGEVIVGAMLFADTLPIPVTTDRFGYYAFTLPKGRHVIRISDAGMKDTRRLILLHSDGQLNIDMQDAVATLKAAIVSAEKTSNTKSVQLGVNRLNIQTIKQVPVVFGEADVLKVVMTLPGVTSVGEASEGFNVRGGSTDENLVLFDGATIYNPTHLFGFFSAFNPDVVKGIELYKSAIPEKYGGRLSSVLDVSMLDGNSKQWSGVAGIGPLTSKFTIQGPLEKDKTMMVAAVRTTYSDWLLNNIPSSAYSNSTANFYDANLRITHVFDAKNTLYLMGYLSTDQFTLDRDTSYKYSNKSANIKWKHIFNNKSYALISAGLDKYQYSVADTRDSVNGFKLAFDINQTWFRAEFSYAPDNRNQISYGFNTIYYKLHPGDYTPEGAGSEVVPYFMPAEQGLESALYLGDQYTVNSRLTVSAGLRYSVFNYLGPHDVYDYAPGVPLEVSTITDTSVYGKGKIIKTWSAPDIRLSARYTLSDNESLKISYNTLEQYIHMLSNTVSISPTDIWKLSDPNIKPQQGDQISLGYYRNFKSNTIEASVEVYYKRLKNYLDYKSGATLLLNPHIETDVLTTKGKAYGAELLLKKMTGKFNGWFSYTYSRTFLKQDDPLAGQLINYGNWYPADFDKPNNLNFIGNYKISHRYSVSANVVYSTGRPITLPLAVFTLGGSPGLYYSERNQYRVPDYFRTDVSAIIDGNHRIKQKTHNFWTVGVYNLMGRKNPYSVYFIQENGLIKGYQLSIFGAPIPFITYTIKF